MSVTLGRSFTNQLRELVLVLSLQRARTKRALLIGIQYVGDLKLSRPHKDVDTVYKLLVEVFHYDPADIIVMKDSPDLPPEFQPTKHNLERVLSTFINDKLDNINVEYFLLYCGHSGQEDAGPEDTEEEDGKNEYILTVDGQRILDNDLHEWLLQTIARLPNSRLAALLDTCHSETLLDAPHYRCNRPSLLRRSVRRVKELLLPFFTGIGRPGAYVPTPGVHTYQPPRWVCKHCCRDKNKAARVICISACKDREETYEDGKGKVHTLTMDVVDILSDKPTISLKNLMKEVSDRCKKKVHYIMCRKSSIKAIQHPQVSSDIPLWYESPSAFFLQPP